MDGITVKVDGLTDLSRRLKKLSPEIAKDFRRRVRTSVSVIVADAKGRASQIGQNGSRRIPAAISATVTNKGAGIRISKKRAPHAGLFERGNTGSRNTATFRHPVFGMRDVWVQQRMHPFLQPAVEAHREQVVHEMLESVEHAKREVL